MKEELKNIKPILKKKDPIMRDPVRFPNCINGFENQSKRDFSQSLSLEQEHLLNEMKNLIK